MAKENNCYIVYSAKRQVKDGTWRNSSVMLDRKGKVASIYNKNHPTIGENDGGILSGRDAPVIECDFGRVAFAVCFDLNFDELRLKYVKAKPDLIVFSSMYHGGMMQAYWAYFCRSHFVGAIASEHETISIDEMIEEFKIERLDDYFARSLAYRIKPGNMEK